MEKIKVLLVEDEPTLAMIIKDTLDGNEFDITLAANGEEASPVMRRSTRTLS